MAYVTAPPPGASSIDPPVPDSLYRLSVEQYHRMIDAGVLYSGDPLELLEGLLIEKHRSSPTIHRLSVEQYHQLVAAEILTPEDRVELLNGLLVQKMSQNPPHAVAAELVVDALRKRLPVGWCVRSEKPIALLDSEPEPDAVVAKGIFRDYLRRHPIPADLALVVEVSDATLDSDRRSKSGTYPAAGIATYWIINLVSRRVEVFTRPSGPTAAPAYADRQEFAAGDAVPLATEGQVVATVAVSDLLP